eukprot:4013722-Prymnesium_polylepis.1
MCLSYHLPRTPTTISKLLFCLKETSGQNCKFSFGNTAGSAYTSLRLFGCAISRTAAHVSARGERAGGALAGRSPACAS